MTSPLDVNFNVVRFEIKRYATQRTLTRDILDMGPSGVYLVLQREFYEIDQAIGYGLHRAHLDPCDKPRGEIVLRSEVRAISKDAGLKGRHLDPGRHFIEVAKQRDPMHFKP